MYEAADLLLIIFTRGRNPICRFLSIISVFIPCRDVADHPISCWRRLLMITCCIPRLVVSIVGLGLRRSMHHMCWLHVRLLWRNAIWCLPCLRWSSTCRMHISLESVSKRRVMMLRQRVSSSCCNRRRKPMSVSGLLLDDLCWLHTLHKHGGYVSIGGSWLFRWRYCGVDR